MDSMDARGCTVLIVLVAIVGLVGAAENYMDYGDETAEKTAAENIHELYRFLLQRNALDNAGLSGVPLEHLMMRKSQRSPALRLRYGRSGPRVSAGVLPRPVDAAVASYDDNN